MKRPNPAGDDAHFVRGDTTNADDLKRAGIEEDVEHFRCTKVDELLVGSRLAAHLLARTAMHPGLSAVVADMVFGETGLSSTGLSYPTTTTVRRSTNWPHACGAIIRQQCWP